MESILVIILLLATHAAVGIAKEQLKREHPYQSSSSTRKINSYCANRISPTSTCCESVFISIYIEGSGTAPCLCRVVAEPHPIMAGLNTTDLLVTFASCRALALGDAPLEATCEGMRLLVVSEVLRIFIVGDQLAIGKETGCLLGMGTNLYPSSALPGQNKDERIGAILNDGTIMTVPKDRIKPSPLLDVWKLAEIITTGMVLHGYLGIMTVIFFWSAYQTKKFTEPTRFITIVIILWVLFSAIHPIQAVSNTKSTPIRKLELKFDAPGYAGWSHDLYGFFTDRTLLEFRATRQKVLGIQTFPDEPPEWLHVNVSDATEWVNFIMRSDNYYVCAYENKQATHSMDEYAKFFPGSITLGFDGSYRSINGERKNLTGLNLNIESARKSLHVLSQYKHGVSDPFAMKLGLTTYVLILCEGQRFTEIDTCIRNGWTGRCYLTRTDKLLVSWEKLSCAILEGWEPSSTKLNSKKRYSRRKTYEGMRKDLGITKAQATGLLRVLIIGKTCEDTIKGVQCVAGKGASCSTSA